MAQSLIEMAKDLVAELVKNDLLAPENMQQQLQQVHTTLRELKGLEDRPLTNGAGRAGEEASTPQTTNWKKSIRKHTVECLVCGQTFKQLSARHLSQHDLDPRTYRQQFGIPSTQPLSAKETTVMRRRIVQDIRPWEKAPTYKKSQEPTPPPPPPPARPKRSRKKAPGTSRSA